MTHATGNEVPVHYFQKLDIRVGEILAVDDFPKARKPLYKLTIDFGELGVKKTGAGLKQFYSKEKLLDKLVIAVVNFSGLNASWLPQLRKRRRRSCSNLTRKPRLAQRSSDLPTLVRDVSSKWNCRGLLLSLEHEGRQSFFDPLDQPELVHHELAHGVHILRFHLQ